MNTRINNDNLALETGQNRAYKGGGMLASNNQVTGKQELKRQEILVDAK